MKSNFFKSYFKANGIVSTLLLIGVLVCAGLLAFGSKTDISSLLGKTDTSLNVLVLSVAGAFLGFGALLGFSGLKAPKANFVDVLRVSGLVTAIVYVVFIFMRIFGGTAISADFKNILTFFAYGAIAVAVIDIAQVIFRFIFAKEDVETAGVKDYFGSFARKYNPLLVLVLGTAIAAGIVLYTIYAPEMAAQFTTFLITNKLLLVGAVASVVVLAGIAIADRYSNTTFIDFIIATCMVAFGMTLVAYSFAGIVAPTQLEIIAYVLILFASNLLLLMFRAVTYTNGKGYTNNSQKVRAYFQGAFGKYNMVLPAIIGATVVLAAALLASAASGLNTILVVAFKSVLPGVYENAMFVDILAYAYCGVGAILVIMTLIYNKFNNANNVRIDKVLPMLFVTALVGVVVGVFGWIMPGVKVDAKSLQFMIVTIANAVFLVYAIIIQIVRIKFFDPVHDMIEASIINAQAEKKAQEEAAREAEEAEEEVVEEEPTKDVNDPFALTEEDEEIYNAIYGVKEEPVQEEVVEEVVEEEPTEEVVEEEVIEEETPVEEVVEEAPAETPVEEATEEADEAEEEIEEEDDDDAEEAEEAEEADGEVVQEEHEKAPNIVLTQFEVLDENGEPKKIKRKFMAKMMYAEPETKEYYNEIRNYLEMYRAKGRQSARCETFRYKGLVAKVALGGKAVKVFLAIDPSFIDENPKYHLKDVSEKKQYKDVPVLIKVRSDRGLKYFKELVDYMMANRAVKPKRNFEPTNYLPQLIPNGEAILGAMGMSSDYMHDSMNVRGIPSDLPDNLEEFIPQIMADPLEDDEVEATVYLDTLCTHFDDNAEVTIDVLKSMHIVTKGNVIRVKARGTLDRKLIIYAEYFEEDALKMLLCTNGTAIKVVR